MTIAEAIRAVRERYPTARVEYEIDRAFLSITLPHPDPATVREIDAWSYAAGIGAEDDDGERWVRLDLSDLAGAEGSIPLSIARDPEILALVCPVTP